MGSDAAWTTETHMLALAVDVLNIANWQRSGGQGNRPDQVPRPSKVARDQSKKNRALEAARAFRSRTTT